ncbi:hypothetical protein M885DRAFT_523075 [Pelagophyceae sp. CCMP2097]|nr:hypothetical protein M885DRAFT_523075 [Pelagophyceae sp. CCMP2097]
MNVAERAQVHIPSPFREDSMAAPDAPAVVPAVAAEAAVVAEAAAPTAADAELVLSKVLRQLEYYFSDAAFPFDDYMQSLLDSEGYVEVAKLTAFPKMQTITKDAAVVSKALAESDSLEVDDQALRVRRKYPLPDVDPNAALTVHVSGFATVAGKEATETKIAAAMAKHGPVSSVRALRDLAKDARALDGSAFVVYETAEAALAAVKANGGVRDGRKIGVYAVLDWFDRQKKKKESMAKKRTSKRDREETEEAEAEAAFTVVSGVVLKFAGLGGTEASREDLKGVIEKHATVKYVEYSRGEEIGHVRLAEQGAAQKARGTPAGHPLRLARNKRRPERGQQTRLARPDGTRRRPLTS